MMLPKEGVTPGPAIVVSTLDDIRYVLANDGTIWLKVSSLRKIG